MTKQDICTWHSDCAKYSALLDREYDAADADTSDPWFVRHEQIMDVALVLASVAAVALAVMAIFLWGWI